MTIKGSSKVISPLKMPGFPDLRFSVGVPAAPGQDHAFIMKTYVLDQSKPVIGNGLVKGPEKVIRRSHQKRTVLFRILFISAKGPDPLPQYSKTVPQML